MRKILVTLLSTVAMMGIASLAFAADGAPVKLDSASLGLAIFGCAIGMAVAAAGCGIGQGLGLKSACEGIATTLTPPARFRSALSSASPSWNPWPFTPSW